MPAPPPWFYDTGMGPTYLSPVVVHHVADLPDAVLKDTAGRGIGDHDGRQVVMTLLNLEKDIKISELRVRVIALC